ncbi:kielin/chordin-like protein [Lingula anatina]|uniref:Kielin/chordin-like protein n=1 Tax=Lingula anatina TaxID=7574 RepID=A0A1S3JZR9_LINAN|nr:kielin/chordin-like protein [Lingula anatina]|eukprot:XP_013415885.1 kielin/chordin-like protein [Lingula anatina]
MATRSLVKSTLLAILFVLVTSPQLYYCKPTTMFDKKLNKDADLENSPKRFLIPSAAKGSQQPPETLQLLPKLKFRVPQENVGDYLPQLRFSVPGQPGFLEFDPLEALRDQRDFQEAEYVSQPQGDQPYVIPPKKHKHPHADHLVPEAEQANKVCKYGNKTYTPGELFQADACTSCYCPPGGGTPKCDKRECQWEPHCLEYDKSEDQCCGECIDYGCRHTDGKIYVPGARMPHRTACEECFCDIHGRQMICESTTTVCERPRCVDPVQGENDCCPVCPRGPNCYLGNEIISSEIVVQVDECTACRCPRDLNEFEKYSGGKNEILAICMYRPCSPCPKGTAPKMIKGKCCPICEPIFDNSVRTMPEVLT